MNIYSLSGIQKIYDQNRVLNISDLVLEEGHIYALLGENGAGKTTLLNILSFLDKPSDGLLFFAEKLVRFDEKEMSTLRKDVALVDQKPLMFSTTVYKNMEFGLKVRKVPKKQRPEMIRKALEMVGMQDFLENSAVTLSGGETQRVALARAFVTEPKVLLCDEPTANVDLANQGIIVDLLKKINKEKNITIIFTTHDRGLAAKLAQETIFLARGEIVPAIHYKSDNRFLVQILEKEDRKSFCCFPSGVQLEIDGLQYDVTKNSSQGIYIDPWKIKVADERDKLTSRNWLKGKIVRVELLGVTVKICFEAGERFFMMITEKEYAQRKVTVGEEMFFKIPSEAFLFV